MITIRVPCINFFEILEIRLIVSLSKLLILNKIKKQNLNNITYLT